jgi:CRISPR-associated endoribonuclease Cas6
MQKLLLTLKFADAEKLADPKFRAYTLAPFFQGVLMDRIDALYAQELHNLEVNPYSLSVSGVAGSAEIILQISALTPEAEEKIIKPLLEPSFQNFRLKALNGIFEITDKRVEELSFVDLAKTFYGSAQDSAAGENGETAQTSSAANGVFNLNFLTPTSFRQDGHYVFTPDIRLIFQSLQMKYGALIEGNKEPIPDILNELEEHTHIQAYNLRSSYFKIHDAPIPGFLGSLRIKVSGSQTLRNYVRVLLEFAQFSGVGIKTSMGMGNMCYNSGMGKREKEV